MPNHCTNEVYMSFKTTKDKDNFLKKTCKENEFSFEAIIPLRNGMPTIVILKMVVQIRLLELIFLLHGVHRNQS